MLASIEHSVSTVYALDCSAFALTPGSPVSVVDRVARISATRDVYHSLSLAMAHGCTVHLLRPELPEINDGRNFHRTADFVRAGYESARRYLEVHAQLTGTSSSGGSGESEAGHLFGDVG